MANLSQPFDPKNANLYSTGMPELVLENGTTIPVSGYAFDDTAVEQIFVVMKADYYLSGNLAEALSWYSRAGNTTGNVVWGTQIACVTSGDPQSVLTKALAAAQTATGTVNGTARGSRDTTITVTNLDSLAVDDWVQVRIYRDASNVADTMAGDAILTFIDVSYAATAGAGAGNVSYPGGAVVDNSVVRYDLTTGLVIQSSLMILDDSGNVTGLANVTATRFTGPATGLRETGGPTDLTMAAVLAKETVTRQGTTIAGKFEDVCANTSAQAITSTSLIDVTNVTFSLPRAGTYFVHFTVPFAMDSATTRTVGFGVNLGTPANLTRMALNVSFGIAATAGVNGAQIANNTAFTAARTVIAAQGGELVGIIVVSGATTITARAQTSTGTLTVQAGAGGFVREL